MTEPASSDGLRPQNPVMRLLVVCGGMALLVAMGVDFSAVIGRHIGHPLLGSIEIVQAAILSAGSSAIVVATALRVHATVHLVVERLPAALRAAFETICQIVSAMFFLLLLAGSLWLMADLWDGHERSELLHLPYRPLHIAVVSALLCAAGLCLFRAIAKTKS